MSVVRYSVTIHFRKQIVAMSEMQDLQEEIRLLKEREASLQRQLMLERERRLHAEKIIENEKNACLELKTLLEQQDKKFRATIALPPSQFTNYFVRDSKSLHCCSACHTLLCMHTHVRTHIYERTDTYIVFIHVQSTRLCTEGAYTHAHMLLCITLTA